ncbi:D-erythro-sphingosine kinase [Kwoniella heveanensis CBS 569]|nr:D-erythro-sphingosine kinase [Kwoniella heveanensis CBS 569]
MASRHQDLPVILHNEKRGLLTVEDGRLDVLQLSRDGRPPKQLMTCHLRNFLSAHLAAPSAKFGETRRLDLHCLRAKGNELSLTKLHVLVEPINLPEAEEWVQTVMDAAYDGLKPGKRVLLLVNPVGGKGKAKSIVHNTVVPILQAAGCNVDLRETKHRLHAEEIVRTIDLVYDVIATASGDGVVYEVINGLAARPDGRKALQTPIAPIPTGSANSLCINLFGIKDTFNVPFACLNVIKGRPLPIDLCSVLFAPSMTRRFSFLSTALGLMSELDIGTEHLRWMGDTRFLVGFLKGITTMKHLPCRIKMKVVEDDKVEMAKRARERVRDHVGARHVGGGKDPLADGLRGLSVNGHTAPPAGLANDVTTPLPTTSGPEPLEPGPTEEVDRPAQNDEPLPAAQLLQPDTTWVTIESGSGTAHLKKRSSTQSIQKGATNGETRKAGAWVDGEGVLYFYAGMMPWIARDLMQWPVYTSGDGVIDIVVQSVVPRLMMVNAITGAEKGEAYWLDCQHYYKASAFIVENLAKANNPVASIDGEAFEWDSLHVEVLPRTANLLSMEGHYVVSDFLKKHDTKK